VRRFQISLDSEARLLLLVQRRVGFSRLLQGFAQRLR